MPRLLRSEQVSGAANFQIVHSDLKAAAELRVTLKKRQSLLSGNAYDFVFGFEKVGVGLNVRSADTSS